MTGIHVAAIILVTTITVIYLMLAITGKDEVFGIGKPFLIRRIFVLCVSAVVVITLQLSGLFEFL